MIYNNEIIKLSKPITSWTIPTEEFLIKSIYNKGDKIEVRIVPFFGELHSKNLKDTPKWYQDFQITKMDFYSITIPKEEFDKHFIRTGKLG